MEKRYNKTVLHLPERLAEQLNYLSLYPITVIEAPSGFGKTTALRECFKKSRQEKSFAVWYTFSGTDDHMSWVEFCSLLKEINPQTAEALCKCGVPSMEMMDEIFPLIENTIFFDDTYLIIDNYQNISKSFRQCITRHLLQNKNHKLHYIIITRQADAELCNLYLTNKILYIGAAYFLFDKADIMAYYKKIGISLTAAETGRLKKSTGGWIKALYFQMQSYIEKGATENSFGINRLIESTLWIGLSQNEQNLLLSLSVFDGFTLSAIRPMAEAFGYSDDVEKFVVRNPFIDFDPNESTYIIHDVLKSFLADMLKNQPAEIKNSIFRMAGEYCAGVRAYIPAIDFFRRVGDFEKILSMDFKCYEFSTDCEGAVGEIIKEVIEECQEDVLRKYPRTLLIFAFELLMLGEDKHYFRIYDILREIFDNSGESEEKGSNVLYGDYNLLITYCHYSDLKTFTEYLKKAFEYKTGPSVLIQRSDSWTLGVPSVMFQYYNRMGGLWDQIELLKIAEDYCSKLTDGHGAGGDMLLKAEILYHRGEFNSAEALCHKAILMGGIGQSDNISIAAYFTLARIAIGRGDPNGLKAALDNIDRPFVTETKKCLNITACLSQAYIAAMLNKQDDVPVWLMDMESMRQRLYDRAMPFAYTIYMKQLVMKGEYTRLLGISGLLLDMAEDMDLILCRIYFFIYISIANEALGNNKKAIEMLNKALDLALPDEIYMPFAENVRNILKNLELIRRKSGKEELGILISCCRQSASSLKTVLEYIDVEGKPVLAKREREIAILAAQGMTTNEIASRLFISGETVKSTLKIVFKKLKIHSRTELKNFVL